MRDKLGRFKSGVRLDKRTGKNVLCKVCKKSIYIPLARLKRQKYFCCSISCASKLKGTDHLRGTITKEVAERISKTLMGRYRGEKSPSWKGGRHFHVDGYVYVYSPNHPNKNKDRCVFEHRLVMEKHLDRYLTKEEHVHHVNGIKDDNRIDNLLIASNSDHLKLEWQNIENNNFDNSKRMWFKKGHIPWNKK